MGEYNRKSNRQWYLHRGMVLARVHCNGSEREPLAITTPESRLVDTATGKEIKKQPKGTCPECGDEIALVPVGTTGTYVIRKHKASTGEYKRRLLISEGTYQKLIARALRETVEPDDLADEILLDELNRNLGSPDPTN